MGSTSVKPEGFANSMLEVINAVRHALQERFRHNNCIPDIPAEVLAHAMADIATDFHMLCDSVGWDMFDFTVISCEVHTPQELFNWWFSGWVRYVQVRYLGKDTLGYHQLELVTITHKQYMEIMGW